MSNEIIFGDFRSYTDFGAILNYFKSQIPSPKIIKEEVPYMNGSYDFSTVGSLGEIVYSERKIFCSLQIVEQNTSLLYQKYNKIAQWLLGSLKKKLIYTGEPDMQYIASVEAIPTWDSILRTGTLQFEFTAEPFKRGISVVGNEAWDTFNFEIDYMQNVEFDVVSSDKLEVYNPGRPVSPTINCDSSMTVTNSDGYTAFLIEGDNSDWSFKLQTGLNSIDVVGTGHIKFVFRKEML